ncbi:MAG: hypothetical protein JWM59_2747 [Verrucomicrobiales bacterium]|nr:hypothetical protein [Verrucomicrobiales bacterium]
MSIDQAKLNSRTRDAIHDYCALLPTTVGAVTEQSRDAGVKFTVANPLMSDRPLEVSTENGELTVYFATGHYHIADYGQGRAVAELVEDMILGIAGIFGAISCCYAAYAGDRVLDGGLIRGSSDDVRSVNPWSKADKIQIYCWDGSGDRIIS